MYPVYQFCHSNDFFFICSFPLSLAEGTARPAGHESPMNLQRYSGEQEIVREALTR